MGNETVKNPSDYTPEEWAALPVEARKAQPHARDYTEAEWRALTEKIRFGSEIFERKPKPRIEKHAREMSEQEWCRELDSMHTKGRNK
jgi:hypothetical protein